MDKKNKLATLYSSQIGKNNQSEFNFIKDKPELVYLIKKLERLASAIHIVTNILPEKEPLRVALREECLLAIKNTLMREGSKSIFISIENSILHCVSLLAIGRASVIISDMNAEVLKKEFLGLLPVIDNIYTNEKERLSFNASALNFELESDSKNAVSSPNPIKDNQRDIYKGHKDTNNVLYKRDNLKDKIKNIQNIKQSEKADSIRTKMILDILKNRGEVVIKDITSLMSGVSSKTIQRDLGTLVLKGVLNKSGERRWSRYSLPKTNN